MSLVTELITATLGGWLGSGLLVAGSREWGVGSWVLLVDRVVAFALGFVCFAFGAGFFFACAIGFALCAVAFLLAACFAFGFAFAFVVRLTVFLVLIVSLLRALSVSVRRQVLF